MQVQVRDRVFETNSSSTHSVTIAENELMDLTFSKENLRNKKVVVPLDYYGWEWARYHTPEEKLGYILSNVKHGGEEARRICEIVERHTGCEIVVDTSKESDVIIFGSENGSNIAYDLKDPKDLISFLFSSNSYILTANDNSGPGEFLQTDLGKVPAEPDFIVDEPTFEERMVVTMKGYDGFKLEVDGETFEIDSDREHRNTWSVLALKRELTDVVVLKAEISPIKTHTSAVGSVEAARNMIFEKFVGDRMAREEDRKGDLGVRIIADLPIVLGGGEGRSRHPSQLHDMDYEFRLTCATTAETIANLREVYAEAANRKLEESSRPAPQAM